MKLKAWNIKYQWKFCWGKTKKMDTESAPVYFNSIAKTVINSKYLVDKSFL